MKNVVPPSLALLTFLCCPYFLQAQELPKAITVATWNLEWFFDNDTSDNAKGLPQDLSAPSKAEWEWKLGKVANVIGELQPTIIALQEVEDREAVFALCKKIQQTHNIRYRYAFVGGYEFATEQDVAFLYQDRCIIEYGRKEQTGDMYDTKEFYNLGKHMFARFQWGEGESRQELLIFNVHLRASPDKEAIRKKQCELVRYWAEEAITDGENVMVLGDFNTVHGAGVIVAGSDVEVIKGSTTESREDDLYDLNEQLPSSSRDTHIAGRQFDRIFVSDAVVRNEKRKKDMVFSRIICRKDLVVVGEKDRNRFNGIYKIPQRERDISDHYPVIAEFLFK